MVVGVRLILWKGELGQVFQASPSSHAVFPFTFAYLF